MNRRNGFTLIELLVVIAIIAILAAILFPIFLRAKWSAKCSADLQSQRQLAMAVLMYSDGNGGNFPWPSKAGTLRYFPKYPSGTNTTISGELIYLLRPYVKNTRVFYCSAVDAYQESLTYEAQSKYSPPFIYTGFYYYATEDWAGSKPVKQAGSPKRILFSCIGGGVGTNAGGPGEGESGHGKAQGIFTFADGHVRFIRHFNYPYSYKDKQVTADPNQLLLAKWPDQ